MKKQDSNKLTFSKEKVANLSATELDQVVGGRDETDPSTYHAFTCGMCTSITRLPLHEEL